MEDRICIDGVWYVRETKSIPVLIDPEDVTYTTACEWETDKWAFKATRILRADDPEDFYPDPVIDITDKREEQEFWVKHDCDNVYWFWGVLENDPESMRDALQMFDAQGLAEFKAFLEYLIERGWLMK